MKLTLAPLPAGLRPGPRMDAGRPTEVNLRPLDPAAPINAGASGFDRPA